MTRSRQAGFTAVEVVVVLVILAALVGVGVWVWKNNADPAPANTSQDTSAAEVPDVDSTDDLDQADKSLDDSDLDAGLNDNTELDAQTDFE